MNSIFRQLLCIAAVTMLLPLIINAAAVQHVVATTDHESKRAPLSIKIPHIIPQKTPVRLDRRAVETLVAQHVLTATKKSAEEHVLALLSPLPFSRCSGMFSPNSGSTSYMCSESLDDGVSTLSLDTSSSSSTTAAEFFSPGSTTELLATPGSRPSRSYPLECDLASPPPGAYLFSPSFLSAGTPTPHNSPTNTSLHSFLSPNGTAAPAPHSFSAPEALCRTQSEPASVARQILLKLPDHKALQKEYQEQKSFESLEKSTQIHALLDGHGFTCTEVIMLLQYIFDNYSKRANEEFNNDTLKALQDWLSKNILERYYPESRPFTASIREEQVKLDKKAKMMRHSPDVILTLVNLKKDL